MSSEQTYVDPHSDAPMEYLGTAEPGRPRRKARPWAPIVGAAVVFLVIVVGAGMAVGDWVERSMEMRTLISQIEVSEHAMEQTQAAVGKALDDFRAKPQPTADDQAALTSQLEKAAADGLVGVQHGGDVVASVRTLPWHADIRSAQQAYLAHNHAWQDYLARAAKDGTEFGKQQDAVNSTFAAAEQPIRRAVPSPDVFGLRERVDVIYAPAPDSGTPGQAA